MIGWIYSDPHWIGLATGVTRGGQKFWEGGKTIVGSSNRFRAVTDVGCDDFMQSGRLLGVARLPSRLAIDSTSQQMPKLTQSSAISRFGDQKPVRTGRA